MEALSPLRYPGGKGQMYSKIEHIIKANSLTDKTYVEPFAGGFAIGITLLKNGIVTKAIINDYDYHIYAFWKAVFNASDALIEKIKATPLTILEWKKQREIYNACDRRAYIQVAFATLYLNRTNFSGVLKGGPIGGQDQKGNYKLDCRFPKERICAMVDEISKLKNSIEVYNLDAEELILNVLKPIQNQLFINFDPPYVRKGKALYTNFYNRENHQSLRDCIVQNLSCDWIMTYDDDELIRTAYNDCNLLNFSLGYSAKEHRTGNELFISKKEYQHMIGNQEYQTITK